MHEMRSRALGALYGLAIGDALGMPVQSLSRAEIVAHYGPLIGEFCPGPDGHPLAAGLPAGSVTDDTEQAMLLARLVVAGGGEVDAVDLAHDLLAWEESMRARGSLDLLGPSTRQALAALAAGADVTEAGRAGLTNGAAMRITPVGIATASRHRGLLEDRVVAARACRVDGPSRSSDPRARIDFSQANRSRARSAASTSPSPATTSRASNTACSVSSVTDPAGSPAASG